MICPRCGDRFDTHEAWADIGWSRPGAGIALYTHICPECADELREWAGIRRPVPPRPFSCSDRRLDLNVS